MLFSDVFALCLCSMGSLLRNPQCSLCMMIIFWLIYVGSNLHRFTTFLMYFNKSEHVADSVISSCWVLPLAGSVDKVRGREMAVSLAGDAD